MNTVCAQERTATVGDNFMYISNNVHLECWFLNVHVLWKEGWIFLCKQTYIDLCTYLAFGLLEAPREHALHGPLLGIYWLRLCPHFGAPTLEAMLLQRRLFTVLMTAAHISTNVLSLQLSLSSVLYTEHLTTMYSNALIHIIHYIHTSYVVLYYFTWYTYVHLASSFLLFFLAGWLRFTTSDTLKFLKLGLIP
jgi:hypothetical protein